MSIYDLILKRRTIRRFQNRPVSYEQLEKMVNAARVAPSAMNMQPLEYVILDDPKLVTELFRLTYWARYIPDDKGRPGPGEEPVAFIAVLINQSLASKWIAYDVGAAMENIILTAMEDGIGTCWIGSVEKEKVSALLNLGEGYALDSVVALGYPAEEPQAVAFIDSQKYYKDDDGTLFVPKRELGDICHHNQLS